MFSAVILCYTSDTGLNCSSITDHMMKSNNSEVPECFFHVVFTESRTGGNQVSVHDECKRQILNMINTRTQTQRAGVSQAQSVSVTNVGPDVASCRVNRLKSREIPLGVNQLCCDTASDP